VDFLTHMSRQLEAYFAGEKGIVAVYLFGSFARGTQSGESDVDLALLLDKERGKEDLKALLDRHLPGLGRLLRREVHVLILNDAPYPVRIEALSRGRLIHVKDRIALARFRMVSFALFAEHAPYMNRLKEKMKQRWMEHHGE